jgi:hypothetical protein
MPGEWGVLKGEKAKFPPPNVRKKERQAYVRSLKIWVFPSAICKSATYIILCTRLFAPLIFFESETKY